MLTALTFIYKIILKALDFILHIIAYIMIFLGAYFPFFYLIYGFIISAIFDFSLFDSSTLYSKLYICGLVLTLIAMLIVAVRSLILKPTSKIRSYFDKDTQNNDPRRYDRGEHYDNRRLNRRPDDFHKRADYNIKDHEKPLVYRSRKFPEIIVHEYSDRFVLYKKINGSLEKIRTEYKK